MGERAVASLKISRSDVVEYQCAFLEVAAGEAVLDEALLRAQPVEGGVDLAHPNGAEAQSLAEGMAGRGGIEHAGGGEFGGGGRSSRPMRRAVARAARTWPCGRERRISKPPSPAGTSLSPRKAARRVWIFSSGQWERLARVRDLTLPSSR